VWLKTAKNEDRIRSLDGAPQHGPFGVLGPVVGAFYANTTIARN